METLSRKTVNFDQRDSRAVAPFLDASTTEHAALEALFGQPLAWVQGARTQRRSHD